MTNNLYRVYPSSPKAAEALLMKASAELSEGEIDEAKKSLNTLIKRYPKSDSAKTAKSRLAQIEKLDNNNGLQLTWIFALRNRSSIFF